MQKLFFFFFFRFDQLKVFCQIAIKPLNAYCFCMYLIADSVTKQFAK